MGYGLQQREMLCNALWAKNPKYIYHINGRLLDACKTYKDLGITVSDDLKAAEQISKCTTKANAMLGMIKRTFSVIDEEIFLKTFKVFVRPILEYCQQVWSPYLQKDIDSVEKVQRRATKLVPKLKDLSYEERLKHLKLFSLEERRTRGDMIFLYKMCNDQVDFDPKKLFVINRDDRTRGHNLKLYTNRSNKDIRRYYYTNRVVPLWNKLPNNVINSTNVSQFKRNYDKYILNKQ